MSTSDRSAIAWLHRRVGFGLAPGELDRLEKLGVDAVVDRLVDPNRHGVAPVRDPWQGLRLSQVPSQGTNYRAEGFAAIGAWLDHLSSTGRPTESWLTWFWHNHFPTAIAKVRLAGLMVTQLRLFQRAGAGSFAALLRGVTVDPAMLVWLDGRDNTRLTPNENYGREVMELFARALRDLGRMLTEQYQGSFESLSAATEGSALRLIEILVQIPFFADVQTYRGLEVPFLLRAQRIAVDLAQAFEGRDLGRFEDLELLAPSADNVIPHVLRTDGVLRYDRGLMERIDRGEPVPAHTEREVEIRASAVDAVERLVADIRARGVATTHVHVDAWLRQRGRHPSYREKPRHRSRTVFY